MGYCGRMYICTKLTTNWDQHYLLCISVSIRNGSWSILLIVSHPFSMTARTVSIESTCVAVNSFPLSVSLYMVFHPFKKSLSSVDYLVAYVTFSELTKKCLIDFFHYLVLCSDKTNSSSLLANGHSSKLMVTDFWGLDSGQQRWLVHYCHYFPAKLPMLCHTSIHTYRYKYAHKNEDINTQNFIMFYHIVYFSQSNKLKLSL